MEQDGRAAGWTTTIVHNILGVIMSILPFYPNMPKAVCPWNPTRSDPLLDLRSGTAAPKTPHMINEKYMAMQICEKQYQSLNISASPSFVSAQGRENEQRGWTEETYDAKNKEPGNRYDWSRKHLNFEIKRGRKIGKINGETVFARPTIIPLGTQEKSLKERYDERLKELKFKPWSLDAPNQPNTCIDFVLNGDHDRMTEIAFGKPMDFDWREDNSSVTLADDPDHPGRKQIETLALDYYDFLCRKFGEENVLGLECHLDETTPHFHALVVPVAERMPKGRTGGYELASGVKSDGKQRPEHINTRQFQRLSEDEQRFYKPAVKKKVPTVSYSYYFGETKYQAKRSYKQWHTMLHEEVNCKWGLARGEDTSLMTPEERKEHRKKSKRKLERERLEALKKAEEAEQKAEAANEKYAVIQEKLQQAGRTQSLVENDIREGREQVAKMATQVETARKDLNDAKQEKDKVQKEKTALEERVEELVNAVGDPKEVANMVSFDKMVFAYNPEANCVIIDNLKTNGKLHVTIMDVLTATFEEIDKIKARKIGFFDDPKEVRKKRDADIKSVMTDMQTILRSFASVHKDELTRRSRAIVKQELRQNAIAIKKIHQYDEMTKRGITIDSYERAKAKADNYDNMSSVLESVWPGLWNAVQVIINPRLDRYVMNDREKETVRKALGDNPKDRLANAGWMLAAVDTIRNIAVGTKSEVYQIGAESAVRFLVDTGLNLAEGIVENVAEVAATTASLFFGYVDAATTISQSCGGGGCNNELPRRKDKEDDLAFARRCHQAAKVMILGSHKRGLHL